MVLVLLVVLSVILVHLAMEVKCNYNRDTFRLECVPVNAQEILHG